MKRRLLIRPGAIGDCILSLPVLEYLTSDYTELWISSPVVPLIGFANQVRPLSSTGLDMIGIGDLPISDLLRSKLRSFDSIVSWYGANRPEFRKALREMGVACEFQSALPPADYTGFATDYFAEQTGAPKGLLPRINVETSAARDAIVIHPFSGSARKNWPLDRYRALASALPFAVEWNAGPEECLPEAKRFANLAELATWMSGARLYIGNDSGITHLAAAIGMPVVALFGPASPGSWVPRGRNVHVLRWKRLDELPVSAVLEGVNRLLGSR